MDVLDIIIIVIVVLGGLNGYRIGLIRQITRLFGAVIAYFLALWLRPYVAPAIASMHWFPAQQGLASVFLGDLNGAVAFGVVFVLAFILMRYGVSLLDALFHLPVLSTINRFAGLIVGLVFAIVFVYVATLLMQYMHQSTIEHQVKHSVIVQWLDGQSLSQIESQIQNQTLNRANNSANATKPGTNNS